METTSEEILLQQIWEMINEDFPDKDNGLLISTSTQERIKTAMKIYGDSKTTSQQQTIERLREGMQNFLKWHEKYPTGRIYNHGTAVKIESELTKLMEEAQQLLNTTEPTKSRQQ